MQWGFQVSVERRHRLQQRAERDALCRRRRLHALLLGNDHSGRLGCLHPLSVGACSAPGRVLLVAVLYLVRLHRVGRGILAHLLDRRVSTTPASGQRTGWERDDGGGGTPPPTARLTCNPRACRLATNKASAERCALAAFPLPLRRELIPVRALTLPGCLLGREFRGGGRGEDGEARHTGRSRERSWRRAAKGA